MIVFGGAEATERAAVKAHTASANSSFRSPFFSILLLSLRIARFIIISAPFHHVQGNGSPLCSDAQSMGQPADCLRRPFSKQYLVKQYLVNKQQTHRFLVNTFDSFLCLLSRLYLFIFLCVLPILTQSRLLSFSALIRSDACRVYSVCTML